MKYFVRKRFYSKELSKPSMDLKEFIVFEYDKWNDYNYITSFGVYYHRKGESRKNIGRVQIADYKDSEKKYEKMKNKTGPIYETYKEIQKAFDELQDSFVSIGNEEYYEGLYKIFGSKANEILLELNDIAYDLDNFEKILSYQVIQKSLLRGTTVFTVNNDLHTLARSGKKYTDYNFSLLYTQNEIELSRIDISTDYKSLLPNNIHAIIGNNGTGKTTILNDIVQAGIDNSLEIKSNFSSKNNDYNFRILTEQEETVKSLYDFFESILYVSFSAFDDFDSLKDIENNNFSYVGLFDGKENKNFDPQYINEKFSSSINEVMGNRDRAKLLGESIEYLNIFNRNVILEAFDEYTNNSKNMLSTEEKKPRTSDLQDGLKFAKNELITQYSNLSSGYKIILLTTTSLVEKVNQKTLVVFDEPELYLHPPLISNFMRAISNIMKLKNGVCLMATHSPVILQEIPRECVNIITHNNDKLFDNKRPDRETFGENISTLTDRVFNLDVKRSGFYLLLSDIINHPGKYNEYKEKISEIELGRDAELYLRILKSRNTENN